MADPLLIVVAEMTARPGKEEALRKALLALIEPTRAEAACRQYNLHESTERPGQFVFYEKWTSRQKLDEHLATPHMKHLGEQLPELLEGEMRVVTYTQIA